MNQEERDGFSMRKRPFEIVATRVLFTLSHTQNHPHPHYTQAVRKRPRRLKSLFATKEVTMVNRTQNRKSGKTCIKKTEDTSKETAFPAAILSLSSLHLCSFISLFLIPSLYLCGTNNHLPLCTKFL